ncbi:Uu.00g035400.m01.CDS01 [Anthostomella pinea]|uniref:Uu.00g035400.m01.CDS01 n=1 Tax=Anthostomella pinea TaxID=933095 RepID=A0AAI8YDG2_9PEZI|nr:Uu.00g035400.m01.CDS01 [Anthostomella pinea]
MAVTTTKHTTNQPCVPNGPLSTTFTMGKKRGKKVKRPTTTDNDDKAPGGTVHHGQSEEAGQSHHHQEVPDSDDGVEYVTPRGSRASDQGEEGTLTHNVDVVGNAGDGSSIASIHPLPKPAIDEPSEPDAAKEFTMKFTMNDYVDVCNDILEVCEKISKIHSVLGLPVIGFSSSLPRVDSETVHKHIFHIFAEIDKGFVRLEEPDSQKRRELDQHHLRRAHTLSLYETAIATGRIRTKMAELKSA